MRSKRSALFSASLAVLLAGACGAQAEQDGGRLRRIADPAELLLNPPLGAADEARLKNLFQKLDGDDFDERQRAAAEILALGPRAWPAVKQHLADAAYEVREFARNFDNTILLHYRGYLPLSPELREKLQTPRKFVDNPAALPRVMFDEVLRTSKIAVIFQNAIFPELVFTAPVSLNAPMPAREALDLILKNVGLQAVPRGGQLVIVTQKDKPEDAYKQEHLFALSPSLSPRLAGLLNTWLSPGAHAEANADGLHVQGTEADLRAAARAVFCLAAAELKLSPPQDGALFPPGPPLKQLKNLLEVLNRPVNELRCEGAPSQPLALLRQQGLPLVFENLCVENGADNVVRLQLNSVPFGVALQWVLWRANRLAPGESPAHFLSIDLDEFLSAPMPSPERHPLLHACRTCHTPSRDAAETVSCTDVSFLFTQPNAPQSDAQIAAEMKLVLEEQLCILPQGFEDFAVAVLDKRLLLRGSGPALGLCQIQLERWRSYGFDPRPEWREKIDTALSQVYDWDGRGLSPGELIPRLRALAKINLMLESADGKALALKVSDAFLLSPGKHTLRDLLDRLAAVANATWIVKAGALVIAPKPELPLK